jgi:hypothetical protein
VRNIGSKKPTTADDGAMDLKNSNTSVFNYINRVGRLQNQKKCSDQLKTVARFQLAMGDFASNPSMMDSLDY